MFGDGAVEGGEGEGCVIVTVRLGSPMWWGSLWAFFFCVEGGRGGKGFGVGVGVSIGLLWMVVVAWMAQRGVLRCSVLPKLLITWSWLEVWLYSQLWLSWICYFCWSSPFHFGKLTFMRIVVA